MIRYSLGQDMIFVILALIASLALLSKHAAISFSFVILALVFIFFEHKILDYVKSA